MTSQVLLRTVMMLTSLNVKVVTAETMTDVTSLYTDLLTGYDVRVRPAAIDQHQTTNITLTFSLNFIKAVDVTTAEFIVMGSVTTQWNDPRMAWTPRMRGGAYSITLSRHSVWTPEFTVINTFDSSDYLGHTKHNVRFVYDGTAVWTFDDKLRTVCNYDVSDYPFDVQTCAIALSPLGLTSSQLRLIIATSTVDVTDLVQNDAWDYVSSSVSVVDRTSSVYVNVEITMSRRHGVYQLMMYSPFVMVFILNLSVFVLPGTSGERVGVAIVCLLSLVIFSKSVVVQLPSNTYPVPKMSIIITVVLLVSSMICLFTILKKGYDMRREKGSKYIKHTWNYDVTRDEKHTKVRVSPFKDGAEVSKCEETRDI